MRKVCLLVFFCLISLSLDIAAAYEPYDWMQEMTSIRENYTKEQLRQTKDSVDGEIESLSLEISPQLLLKSVEMDANLYILNFDWLGGMEMLEDSFGRVDIFKLYELILSEMKNKKGENGADRLMAALSLVLDDGGMLRFNVEMPEDQVEVGFEISPYFGEIIQYKEFYADAEMPPQVQILIVDDREGEDNVIHDYGEMDTMPQFPGGDSAFGKWLGKNLVYPEYAQKQGVQGRVILRFCIEKDGSISNIRIVDGEDLHLMQAAVQVISKIPAFEPATQNGKPVRSEVNLPVAFMLN